MGLPLFVAPVESDIPSNSAEKSAALHHPRSSIRRSRRPDERENRAIRRRYAAIRETYPAGGSGTADQLSRPPRYPWIESGYPPPPEAYIPTSSDAQSSRHRPLRDALREMASRGNMINEERLVSLFGERWVEHMRSSNSPPPPLAYTAPEVGDVDVPMPRSLSRHAQSRNLDDAGGDSRRRRHRIAGQVAARFDRSPDLPDVPPAPLANARGYLMRGSHRRAPPVDGLGDRERSLSPEGDGVWDTLLSTLTPDPQPPSVGSSFASASASASAAQSQSAAASSSTSLTGPEMADDSVMEQPCESGCENSDSEDPDDLSIGTEHWSMNYPSRYRRFVRDLDTVDPGTVSFVRGEARPVDIQRAQQAQRLHVLRERVRQLEDARRDMPDEIPVEMRARRFPRPQDRQSRTSVPAVSSGGPRDSPPADILPRGNSEERRATAAQSDADADSVPGPQSGHDDAWDGMQRIFRNLSRREDIPDEWWAGAGLSRTLPDDA